MPMPMPNALFPMPNAQCPMPNAQCPMPNALCLLTFSPGKGDALNKVTIKKGINA